MGLFSVAKLFGMTIRESATDGSDFTNPDADYRRLFLGEDGNLHLKDSAGTVTDIGGGGGDVATDTIWDAAGDLAVGSGANTAARLAKGNAGGYLAMGNGAVIWNAGTSFPANKATGDRYWRTDLGMEFYWDGTRWVTTTLFTGHCGTQALDMAGSGYTANTTNYSPMPHPTLDIYIVDFWASTYVITTNDGTKYWTLALNGVTGASLSTVSNAANSLIQETATVNQVKTAGNAWVQCDITKVSTAGALVAAIGFSYRIIAT